MPTSDAAANAALDREVTAGGSWWVGLALSLPDPELTSVDEAPMPRIELPRTGAAWASASGRSVHPEADIEWPDPAPSDFTPLAWVLWSTETGGAADYAGRVSDTDIVTGSTVVLPAEALTLNAPADLFDEL